MRTVLSRPGPAREFLGIAAVAGVLAWTALAAQAAAPSAAPSPNPAVLSHDPDRPLGAPIDPASYLDARRQYFDSRIGDTYAGGGQDRRAAAIARAQRDQTSTATATTAPGSNLAAAGPTWTALGPAPLPNGQTVGFYNPVSGRATAVAVDPTNSDNVYVGSAGGGVFRSTNGGSSWTPIADGMQVLAVGALALAPDHTTLYVGTGEGNLSGDSYAGVGLYRIDNASSATPTLVGPINPSGATAAGDGHAFSGRSITRIVVSPTNSAVVYVGTDSGIIGKGGSSAKGGVIPPLSAKGLYRTTNGQAAAASVTFTKLDITGAGDNVGVTDFRFDAIDPNVIVAGLRGTLLSTTGLWRTANATSNPPSWTQVLSPSPSSYNSIWHLATTSAGPATGVSTWYAADDEQSGLVRMSTTAGATWSAALTGFTGHCGGQCFYDDPVAVSPTDGNLVLAGGDGPGHIVKKSTNAGSTATSVETNLHADMHDLVFVDSSVVWAASDGGVFRSLDAGSTWVSRNTAGLNTLQFQSLATHPLDSTFSIGGTQDNGTEWLHPDGGWTRADFGDGGYSAIDQNATDSSAVTMYHTYFNQQNSVIGFGRVTSTASAADYLWTFYGCNTPTSNNGIGCGDRTLFYAPLELGPGTPNSLYFGTDRLYRSGNTGTSMTVVSQAPITSNASISSIGISTQNDQDRLVGLDNGHVWSTTTGSSTLVDVSGSWPKTTPNTQGVFVADTVIDPTDQNTAFVALGNYFGSTTSHLWRTTTLGTTHTWSEATGLPDVPVNSIAVDRTNHTNVYAGTDIGVYRSTDGGASFSAFGVGLPAVAVFDMSIVQPGAAGAVLRIATHGRGLWQIPLNAAATVTSLTVAPSSASVPLGDAPTFTATAGYSDGSSADVTGSATWSSTQTAVADVAAGVVTTHSVGSTTITATYGGQSGNASVTVTPAVVRDIAVSPTGASVPAGATQQYTAIGTYSDGSTSDLSSTATWDSTDPSVATVSTTGLATSLAPGSTVISATYGGVSDGKSLTVTPAVLSSLAVTPSSATIAAGATKALKATATFSDASTQDVTSSATWSSDDASATVDTTGVVTAVSPGSATITAAYGGMTGTSAITTTSAALQSITVSPAAPSVPKGDTQAFTATGSYSDGSSADVTADATWLSSDTGVATVNSSGVASTLSTGTTSISATVGSVSGTASLTVTAAELRSIVVTPDGSTIAKGDTQTFTATGTYSDGSQHVLPSNDLGWTSSDPAVATIYSGGPSVGVAQSVDVGSTTITATIGDLSDGTTLTVAAAALRSIAVSPTTPSVPKGDTQAFTATGTYSDGTTQALSSGVTWASSAPTVASVSSSGLASTLTTGTSSISATVGSVSGNTLLTVTSAALRSIAVAPSTASVAVGGTKAFTATGTYSDGSTQSLTSGVTWATGDSSIATIGSTGTARGVGPGTTSVTATVGAVASPGATLTVTPGPPTITGFTPSSGPVGTTVTITGTNLGSPLRVSFGSVAATVFSGVSSTQLTAHVPTGSRTARISVSTGTGTATSRQNFRVTK